MLKCAAKNAAGQLLAGFANNTRNCPLAVRINMTQWCHIKFDNRHINDISKQEFSRNNK
jgi:hypothetical protein